jgi:hypothetical protein
MQKPVEIDFQDMKAGPGIRVSIEKHVDQLNRRNALSLSAMTALLVLLASDAVGQQKTLRSIGRSRSAW